MIEFNDVMPELEAFKKLHYPANDFPIFFNYTANLTFSEIKEIYSSLNYSPLKNEFCKYWLCYLFLTLSKKSRVDPSALIKPGKYRVTYPIPSYVVKVTFSGPENSPTRKSAKRTKLLKEGAELPPELRYTSKAWRIKKGLE